MCLAAPARILALDPAGATIELAAGRRRAALTFQPEVAVGDWVLVAAGSVVRRISPDEARELQELYATALAPEASAHHDAGQGGPR